MISNWELLLVVSLVGNSGRLTSTNATLPIPISVCSIFVCPDNGMDASVWDF